MEKLFEQARISLLTRQTFRQLWRYGCAGAFAAFADLFFLYILTSVFGVWYVASAAGSYGIGLCIVFLVNKYWSFQKYSFTARQLSKFLVLMFVNYLLVLLLIALFTDVFGYPYILSKIAIIVLQTTWNFFLYKYWVFQY